ncbi:hypothetical protein F5Y16DRAFT_368449 [Xylariaceae sp. FL0255]|nr:hypothetical protein F5Y16DRAFT_368449 [Xylariaceae sp. FL0255]
MDNQIMPSSPAPLKFEASPAESLLSAPGDFYPSSLFATTADIPEDVMSPPDSINDAGVSTPAPETPAADSEKKPAKKRKSWGQVLPEPKTNLPPRKRAKTEDEKEQRRVERVLRNRRAAQSSRERKRLEAEALEQKNSVLEEALAKQIEQNKLLLDELNKLRQGGAASTSLPIDNFSPSPLTLSQELDLQPKTVNPASLTPELNPVADDAITPNLEAPTVAALSTAATSTDATQHPAVMLWDLQCPSVEVPPSWAVSRQPLPPMLSLYLQLQTLLTASSALISACFRPMTLITGALKSNLVLQPTPSILSTIIWLVTLPPNFRTSTSVNLSATTPSAVPHQARQRASARSSLNTNLVSASSTLRIKSLQKLLTCSPILARPLMDATMELLRSVSNDEGLDTQVEGMAFGSPGIKGDQSRGPLTWPEGTSLPSREVLLTLLWAIRVEERRLLKENRIISSLSSRPGSSVLSREKTPNVVSSAATKRKRGSEDEEKRTRFRLGL